jgi:hypothetical protein
MEQQSSRTFRFSENLPDDFLSMDERSLNSYRTEVKSKVQLQKSLAMFIILDFMTKPQAIRL